MFLLPKKVVFIKNNLAAINVGLYFGLRMATKTFLAFRQSAVTFLAGGVISQEGLEAFSVLWYIMSKPSIRDSSYLS